MGEQRPRAPRAFSRPAQRLARSARRPPPSVPVPRASWVPRALSRVLGRRLLRSLAPPQRGNPPRPPGTGQLGAPGRRPGVGVGGRAQTGGAEKAAAPLGSPDPRGRQQPLTRWPRGAGAEVSGSPAAPGRASQIRTANAGRERASGAGAGGPCGGTCRSPRACTDRTKGRGAQPGLARVYLLNRRAGRDQPLSPVPALHPGARRSRGGRSLRLCASPMTPEEPWQFLSPLRATSVQNPSPSLHGKTEKESSGRNAPW